jgi:hydrophobe/amphiphile efflux-3 (HAE3) family protein
MQRAWAWLGLNLGKHAGVVSLVGLVVTLGLGFGITRLEFATGQDSYLNDGDEVAIDNEAYQGLFGGQAMVTVFTMEGGASVTDLFTPANIDRLEAVGDEIRAGDGIRNVITPLTALEFTEALVTSPSGNPAQSVAGKALLGAIDREPTAEGKAARQQSSVVTLQRLDAIPPAARTLDNRDWVDFLLHDNDGSIRKSLRPFFPDEQHTQIVTRLVGNASIDEEAVGADVVVAATDDLELDGAITLTAGAPVLLQELNDYLRGGMLSLGAIAVAIMVIILLVAFDVRWRLLPLAVILVGVVWAFGLAGYLGIPLSVVTIAGLPVMLGVGIDYAIQMHSRVEEEVIIDSEVHPIQETSRNLGPALLVVTFDAVFAFLALRFARVPMIRDFGLLLAVGIAAICLCSIILPLSVLGIREYRSPTKGRDFRRGPLGRLVLWLGSLPTKAAIPLTVASIVIFFGGLAVEDDLVLQTDPVRWVDQGSDSVKAIEGLEAETGSSSELGVYVQADDVFGQDVVDYVHGLAQRQLAAHDDDRLLLTASSIVTTMSYVLEIPGAEPLAPTAEDVAGAYEVAPRDIQASLVSDDGTAMNLVFRSGPASLEERKVVVDELRDDADPPPGVSATPSGLAVVGTGLLENLEANRVQLTYLAILFVFLFLAVRLRSVVRALLSLVPVLIAVGAASLVAYAAGLKLSPMTAVGGPLVIAACTEFTSLILLRFIEERRRGMSPKEAVEETAERTGRAFIVSAMTAIAGVAVIAFSSMPVLRDFGLIVAMNVTVALASALVVLPPMLVWAEEHGWVTRGLLQRGGPQRGRATAAPAD